MLLDYLHFCWDWIFRGTENISFHSVCIVCFAEIISSETACLILENFIVLDSEVLLALAREDGNPSARTGSRWVMSHMFGPSQESGKPSPVHSHLFPVIYYLFPRFLQNLFKSSLPSTSFICLCLGYLFNLESSFLLSVTLIFCPSTHWGPSPVLPSLWRVPFLPPSRR